MQLLIPCCIAAVQNNGNDVQWGRSGVQLHSILSMVCCMQAPELGTAYLVGQVSTVVYSKYGLAVIPPTLPACLPGCWQITSKLFTRAASCI